MEKVNHIYLTRKPVIRAPLMEKVNHVHSSKNIDLQSLHRQHQSWKMSTFPLIIYYKALLKQRHNIDTQHDFPPFHPPHANSPPEAPLHRGNILPLSISELKTASVLVGDR